MPGTTPSSYWQILLDLWCDPKAESFLQDLFQEPIPKSGPLHKLLLKTEKLLAKATSPSTDAAQAERCGAITLLARILHRLQQHPCEEDHFGPPQAPMQTTWYSILQGLSYVVQSLASKLEARGLQGGTGPRNQHLSWVQQLQGEAGMCRLGACHHSCRQVLLWDLSGMCHKARCSVIPLCYSRPFVQRRSQYYILVQYSGCFCAGAYQDGHLCSQLKGWRYHVLTAWSAVHCLEVLVTSLQLAHWSKAHQVTCR